MNKYHCLALGIGGIVVLDALAIIILKTNGTVMLAAATAIGGLIGIAFGVKSPAAKDAKKEVIP
jgi:hypothetical protein